MLTLILNTYCVIYSEFLISPVQYFCINCSVDDLFVVSSPQFPDATGYVGFANLPNQVHRKSVKKGFEFTLMVVGEWSLFSFNVDYMTSLENRASFSILFVLPGESGLGKSTLINSLFLTDLYPERCIPGAAGKLPTTYTCIHIHQYAHCNIREMSAAKSPAAHYFKRNVGNALVSEYDPALLMTWLRLGLVLAWKQLQRPSLIF